MPRKCATPNVDTTRDLQASAVSLDPSATQFKTIHRILVEARRSFDQAKSAGCVDATWLARSNSLLDEIDAWFAGKPFRPELNQQANMRRFRSYMSCMKRAHALLLAVQRELLRGYRTGLGAGGLSAGSTAELERQHPVRSSAAPKYGL